MLNLVALDIKVTPKILVSSISTIGDVSKRLLSDNVHNFFYARHVFTCRLLSRGSPVNGRNITLTLNSTSYTTLQYSSLRTNASGYAWLALYLSPQANNNQTAYNVVASFSGDTASAATATMTLLNGTSYAVCTTTQYNTLEPCARELGIELCFITRTLRSSFHVNMNSPLPLSKALFFKVLLTPRSLMAHWACIE